MCAGSRAIGYPKFGLVRGIQASEQDLVVKDHKIGVQTVKKSNRRPAADTGKFMCVCGRSVCYPETVIACRVNTAEQNLFVQNGESGKIASK
jgi:hypothetical protein